MNASEMLQKMGDSLGSKATVKSVFGEPIQMDGKTVVPIAKVAYGFGAGGGTKPVRSGDPERAASEGSGGGGGVAAYPVGALEITSTGTRFIPFIDLRVVCGILMAGAMLGRFLFKRR